MGRSVLDGLLDKENAEEQPRLLDRAWVLKAVVYPSQIPFSRIVTASTGWALAAYAAT